MMNSLFLHWRSKSQAAQPSIMFIKAAIVRSATIRREQCRIMVDRNSTIQLSGGHLFGKCAVQQKRREDFSKPREAAWFFAFTRARQGTKGLVVAEVEQVMGKKYQGNPGWACGENNEFLTDSVGASGRSELLGFRQTFEAKILLFKDKTWSFCGYFLRKEEKV